jgi:uncharacterized protein YbjT (DUF2867 family)
MGVEFENDILLITAAGGKQARELLKHVAPKWKRLRLNVSSDASKQRLQKQYPNAEIFTCDVSDPHACKKLFENVTACYMVTPGFHPHETECGYNMIDAALANIKTGGPFKHMLHSSVLHPILRAPTNHDSKRMVEEYLVESGLPYTIIQPTHIMETVSISTLLEQQDPVIPRFWNPNTPFSFVTARDIGEAAANILSQREKHFYATYQLVSTPEPLSYVQAADIISEEIGKQVRLDRRTVEEGVEMMIGPVTSGNAEDASWISRQGLGRMLLHYNDRGLIGNSNVLEMLLGRKSTGYREWVRLSVEELRNGKKQQNLTGK